MPSTKTYIKAQYTADGLGNRWNNSTTEIILSPADPPVKGLWASNRESDIDSTGGSDNAVFYLNKISRILSLKTEKPGSQNVVNTPVMLFNVKDLKVGARGTGIFNFRKTDFPITWEIIKVQ